MEADIGTLPGTIVKLTPNGSATADRVLPRGQTQSRATSGRQSDSGDSKLRLNIGGVVFKTHSQTLQRFPGTRLARLTTQDDSYDQDEKEFFFDRNSLVFHGVLDYYRTGELHVPHNICARVVHNELTFWGLQDKELCECCWQKYQEYRDTEDCLRTVMDAFCDEVKVPPLQNSTRWQHYKNLMWNVLEYPSSSCLAKIWSIGFSITMLISIFITVFETMPEFRVVSDQTYSINITTSPKEQLALSSQLHPVLVVLECTSSLLLTIDLVLRLIFCPSKPEFFKSPLNWIELISQIMVWFVASHYLNPSVQTDLQLTLFIAATCLRNLRVLRLFRTARHLPAWRILMLSLRSSTSEILVLSAFVFTGVLVFAVLIYSAQFHVDDQFTNVPIGFWWAIVTMTTVGYGDFYPTTIPGYLVGALCALCGLLATGLPIPIIANNFSLLYSYYKMSKPLLLDGVRKHATGEPCIVNTSDDHGTKSVGSNDSAFVEEFMLNEVREKPKEPINI